MFLSISFIFLGEKNYVGSRELDQEVKVGRWTWPRAPLDGEAAATSTSEEGLLVVSPRADSSMLS